MVDIILLNYNDSETTSEFLESVKNYSVWGHIVVVDNASSDHSYNSLLRYQSERICVIRTERNGGYGAGNNAGFRFLRENFGSEYILLSNPDVKIAEESIRRLEDYMRNDSSCVIASALMTDRQGNVQPNSAFKLPSKLSYINSLELLYGKIKHPLFYDTLAVETFSIMAVGGVSGSCFMMCSSMVEKYGLFDENIFLYCEEMTLAKKYNDAGLRIVLLGDVRFVHNHSVSISKTFKSEVRKQCLLTRSKLYVIKNYFHANKWQYMYAKTLAWLSIVETYINSIFK